MLAFVPLILTLLCCLGQSTVVDLGASSSTVSHLGITGGGVNSSELYPLTDQQLRRDADEQQQKDLRNANLTASNNQRDAQLTVSSNLTANMELERAQRSTQDAQRVALELNQTRFDVALQKSSQDKIDADNKALRDTADELNAKAVLRQREMYANSYGHHANGSLVNPTVARLGDVQNAKSDVQNAKSDTAPVLLTIKKRTDAELAQRKVEETILIEQQDTLREDLREQHVEDNTRESTVNAARKHDVNSQQQKLRHLTNEQMKETNVKTTNTYKEAATKQKLRRAHRKQDRNKRANLVRSQNERRKMMVIEQNWENTHLHQVLSAEKLLTHAEARKALSDLQAKELRRTQWNAAEAKSKEIDRVKAEVYWDKVAKQKIQQTRAKVTVTG